MKKPRKEPFGRPTEYKPEYCQKLIEYFSVKPYELKKKQIVTKSGEVCEIEQEVANDMPTLAGFAIQVGVDRHTLAKWAKKHTDFGAAYKMAKEFQENYLVKNGMKSLIHPVFSIFVAKNVIGWRDKVEINEEEENTLEFE